MRVLAGVGGVPVLGLLIDIGALVSMFAGTLACITAAARVLLLMSHNGLAHDGYGQHIAATKLQVERYSSRELPRCFP